MPDYTLNTPSVNTSVDIGNINLQGLIEKANSTLSTANPNTVVNSGFNNTAITPDWQSKGFGKPLEGYDSNLLQPVSGYNKFKTDPTYNPEFSPIQNQREYAANQGKGEFLYNTGAKLVSTSWNAFKTNFQQYGRDLSALMRYDGKAGVLGTGIHLGWNPQNLASNQNTNDTKAEDELYPTMGSGENSNSWLRFIPFTHGSGDFWGSMIPSLGFTIGTMGGALLENAALAYTTGGIGNVLEGANTTRKIGSAITDLYDTFTGYKAYKRGLALLDNVTKEANIGDKIITGAKSMANFYQIYHTAASEAAFQASGDYSDTKQKAIDDFTQTNGHAPYGSDLDKIEKQSQNAKLSSFIENLAVLIPSNLEQFPNIMRPYSLIDDAGKVGKYAIGNAESEFALGEKTAKVISKNKFIQNTWNFISNHKQLALDIAAEGNEEISQSVISNYNKAYYTSKLNGQDPFKQGVDSVKDYLFSPNFWNDFMGGALGGAIFHGVGHIKDLITGEHAESKTRQAEDLSESNKTTPFSVTRAVAQRVFNPDVSNLNSQQFHSQALDDAFKNDDILAYKDTQDDSFRDFLWNRATTGKFNIGLEQLSLMKNLEGEDFKKAFGIEYDTEKAKVANDLVDKLIDRAKKFESDYIAVNRYYSNPYRPDKFKEGSPEQLKELVFKNAFDNTVKNRVFTRDIVQRDKERQNSIFNNLETTTHGIINRDSLQNFFINDRRQQYIKDLQSLNKSYEDATDKSVIQEDYNKNKEKLSKSIAISNQLDNNLSKEELKDVSEKIFNLNESTSPDFNINNERDYDKSSVINDIIDGLHMERRRKSNVEAYQGLQTKEGFEKYLQSHAEVTAEVLDELSRRDNEKEIVDEKDSNNNEIIEPEATSEDIENQAKTAGIQVGNTYTLGKGNDITTNRKIGNIVYPFNTDEEKQAFYNSLQTEIDKKQNPETNNIIDTSEMTPSEFDDLYKQEAKSKQFVEATRKPISSIAFTDTAPKFETKTTETEYLFRKEFMLHNLFFKKGEFGKRADINLQVVPLTPFNVKELSDKTGFDLSKILARENSQYTLSEKNIGGNVILLYTNKNKDGSYTFIDKDGNDITNSTDVETKLVQGFLVDLTTDKYPDRTIDGNIVAGRSKFDADTDSNQKKIAIANNIAIRKSLLNNNINYYNFSFSDGKPNNKLSKDSVSFQQTSIKDAGLYNTGGSIIIPHVTNGNSRVEGTQLLIKGRPYLIINGQDEHGNSRLFYQYLDNTNLTNNQKKGIKDAVGDLKSLSKEDFDLDKILKKETDREKQVDLRDKISDIRDKKTIALNYIKGLVSVVDYDIKNDEKNKYKLQIKEKNGKIGFSYLAKEGNGFAIHNSDNIDSFIDDKYHRINREMLSKEFTDYATGKKYSTYEDYLLNSENPPLTVRMNGESENTPLPYVQRYSTIDFKNIQGVVAIPTNPKAKNKTVETQEQPKTKTVKSSSPKSKLSPKEKFNNLVNRQKQEEAIIENNQGTEQDPEDLSDFFVGGNIEEFKNPSINNEEVKTIPSPIKKNNSKSKAASLFDRLAKSQKESEKNSSKTETNKASDKNIIKEIPDRLADDIENIKLPFDTEENNEPFQLERVNYSSDSITNEDLIEFKNLLSQVDFKYNSELERYFKGRRVWGSFKGNIVQLYSGATKGTLYHEAFETVFNAILTKKQQNNLIDEFRKRKGSFLTFNNEEKLFNQTTNLEAKEKIADEFFDWKKEQGESPHKNFFQKLWDFVKGVFNKLLIRNSLDSPTINSVYNNISSGNYNGIELRNSFDEYFSVGNASEREIFESIGSTTGLAFKKISESGNSNDKNLFGILKALEEGTQTTKDLYDFIKKTLTDFYSGTTSDFKANYETRKAQIIATGLDVVAATKQAQYEAKRSIALFNKDILPNWEQYTQSHMNMMSGLGISFKNSKISEDEDYVKELGEDKDYSYNNDYLKFDNFRSISSSVKLFVAALTDGQFEKIDGKDVVVSTISPFTLQPILIENSKLFFNRLVNLLANTNDIEAVRKKLKDYIVLNKDAAGNITDDKISRNIKANVKTLLDRIFSKEVDNLSEDELSIRLKFFSAFNKQMPDFQRFKIDSDNNVRFVNELYETNVKAMLKEAYDKIFNSHWENKANSWIKYYKGDITIGGKNSPLSGSGQRTINISNLSSGLSKLGFNYSEDRLKLFSPNQLKIVSDTYNHIADILSEEKVYVKGEKKLSTAYVVQEHIGSRLNTLAESLLENTLDETNPMHYGPDGQAQNNYTEVNTLSNILSEVNNSQDLNEFKKNNPQYNDIYCEHSLLLNEKFFNNKNRTWRLTILPGVEITSDEKKNKKAINTSKPELFITRFNATLQTNRRDAIYPMYENADGSIDWALQAGKYLSLSDKEKIKSTYFNYLIDEVNFALDFANNPSSKRKLYEELNKKYPFPSKNGITERQKGKSLQFFSSILSPDQLDKIHFQIDENTGTAEQLLANAGISSTNVYSRLRYFIDDEYRKEKEYLTSQEILTNNENGNKLYLLDSYVDKNLDDFGLSKLMEERILNYITHNIELSKVFFGAPSYYADPLKRFKSFMSPRLSTLRDKEGTYNKWFNNNLNKVQGIQLDKNDLTYHEFSENMNFISIDDIKTKSALESVFKNFSVNDSTDAQMYMMISAARELYWKSGANWTSGQERQYQLEKSYERLQLEKKGFYNYDDENLKRADTEAIKPYWQGDKVIFPFKEGQSITVIKPIGTGVKTDGLFSPNLIKTSAAPLSWSVVEGTLMEDAYIDMLNNNIHALTYKSAHKVGQQIKNGKVPSIINEDGSLSLPSEIADTESIPWYSFGIQTETQSQKDKGTIGSQLMKLITLDTIEHGVPIDYKSLKAKSPYTRIKEWVALSEDEKKNSSSLYSKISRHDDALRNLNTVNYYNFLDKFGVNEVVDKDGNLGFSYKNKDAFKKVIEDSLVSQNVPQHILDQLNYDSDKGIIPIEMMDQYQLIQHVIYSNIDRNVLSFKVNGGQKIQMTSMLLDRAKSDGYTVHNENGKTYVTNPGLKFYEKGKDGTTRMQVILSYRIFSEINNKRKIKKLSPLTQEEMIIYLKDNQPKLLQGIGFRIPTQAVSSIDAFDIKGFLPEYLGDVIAVPSELPTKAGSDFDVDKLNTYLSNYTLNNEGLPEYVPTFKSIEIASNYFREKFQNLNNEKLLRLSNENKQFFRLRLQESLDVMAYDLEETKRISNFIDKNSEKLNQLIEDNNNDPIEAANQMFSQIDMINKKITNLNDIDLQKSLENSYVKNMVKKSTENEYFESIADLLLDKSRFNKLISPNNTEPFTKKGGHVDQTLALKNKKNLGDKLNYGSLLSFSDMIDNRNNNAESKKDVGIGAVGVTSHANFQRFLSVIKMINDDNLIHNELEDYIKFPHNKVTVKNIDYPSLSSISKSDGENISEFLSMYINGTVDVTRNPWLKKYGAYAQAFPVAITAEKLGMNSSDIKLLINHPAVKEYMRITALKQSPVYIVNPSLQEKYGSLYSDESYFNKFTNDIKGNLLFNKKSFSGKDLKIIENQIKTAGENEDYTKFIEGLKTQDERDVALSTIKQFLILKEISSDIRQNVSSSNHETVYLNSNVIIPVKDSNLAKVDSGMVKAYSSDNKNLISAGQAIRDNTFVGKWISNLKKIESFLYGNINLPHTKHLNNFLIRKISNNSEREVSVKNAVETVKKFETVMYSSIIQDALNENKNFFSIDNPNYKFLNDEKERADSLIGSGTIQRMNEGLGVFDYITPRPMGDSGFFYMATKDKPGSSDILGSNAFYEAFRNMKYNNPKLYSILTKATVLQSGTQFSKNSFTSFIQPDDYFKLADKVNDIKITANYVDELSILFAQNNYKQSNGIVARIERGARISPIDLTKAKLDSKGVNNIASGRKPIKSEELSAQFPKITAFPKEWYSNKYNKWIKSRNVNNDFISWNSGKNDTLKWNLMKKVGEFTKQFPNKEMTYSVYTSIPVRGTGIHLEVNSIIEGNSNSYNSQFDNPKFSVLSNDEILNTINNLKIDSFVPTFEENTSIIDDQDTNNIENENIQIPDNQKESVPLTMNNSKIDFQEEQTSGYRNRTIKNASADATIALAMDFNSAGEKLTKSSVLNQNKKYIPVDLNNSDTVDVERIVRQLNSINVNNNSSIVKNNWTENSPKENPNTAYIFTENINSIGSTRVGSGSAIIRNNPNAIGIITKKYYVYSEDRTTSKITGGWNQDFQNTEADFELFKKINLEQFAKIDKYDSKIFPQGFASNLAKIPTRFAEWLQTELLNRYKLVTELNTKKTGLISKNIQNNKGISLNIAGNGIYTLKGTWTQQQLDNYVYELLKDVVNNPNLNNKIQSIRTGGQTGLDEAGAKAGLKLGIPTTILAPKGWTFRDINGQDISNEQEFKNRFIENNNLTSLPYTTYSDGGGVVDITEQEWNTLSEEEKQKILDCQAPF